MSINVYGWRKPTLELELVEGGSLVADTTYYICGFMKMDPATYCGVSSPLSDVYSITTTTTAKSIKITQKTYRNITAFSDNGDGKTLVTCPRHCLISNDQIKIPSGSSYAGTWIVTYVNYDSFTIETTYVDDIPVECYSDSTYYNKPPQTFSNYPSAIGMTYHVGTTNPMATGIWAGATSQWTDRPYTSVYTGSNPLTITALPTINFSNATTNLTVDKLNVGLFKETAENYGTIVVVVDSEVTFEDIYNEVQASGFLPNCTFSTRNKYTFVLVGSLVFISGGELSASATNITIIGGEFYHRQYNTEPPLELIGCMVNSIPDTFSAYYAFALQGGVFYNTSIINTTSLHIYGDDSILFEAPRVGPSVCDIPNQTYTDLVTGNIITYGIIQNKTFKHIGAAMRMQVSYNANKFINVKTYPFWWIFGTGTATTAGTNPDMYSSENCTINEAGTFTYHFAFTQYTPQFPYTSHLKFLNINSDHVNNVKKCVNGSTIQAKVTISFYRRIEFYVKNNGNDIDNVEILIIDNENNTYTGITDSSGYTYIDCLEQRTEWENKTATSVWTSNYDTYYTNFEITASKDSYDSEKIYLDVPFIEDAYNTILNIGLNNSTPVITSIDMTNPSAYDNDGVIIINATGGTAPYQYSIGGAWQTGGTFNGLSGDTYTVSVKDAIDMVDSISGITLTTPAFIKPVITSVDIINPSSYDNDGVITINASGGTLPYQYSIGDVWQSGSSFNNLSGGVYVIGVKDANGLIDVISGVTLVAAALIKPKIDNLVIIDSGEKIQPDGSIRIVASEGTPPYQYSLNFGNYQNDDIFKNLPSGMYTVSVKDSLNVVTVLAGIKVGYTPAFGGVTGRRTNQERYQKVTKVDVKNVKVKDVDLNEGIKIKVMI